MTTHVMTDDRPIGRHLTTTVAARNGMGGGLPTGANDIVHSRVLDRAVQRLTVTYGSDLEPGLIRRTVQRTYRELEASARVKTFLPATAVHLAENRLRELARTARDGRADATPAPRVLAGGSPAGITRSRERAAA
ncbi:three-helix bundle dimerization domain-containing protein [Micrococcus sp. TA1]|uniref:three-helix bundle dimerization domain-containing protein n=1 Tax=Micrococcus sp. TA1 TaxID=681627 RepID=UPI00161B216C|nr:hypothetical protein [Micrococcus sp. TA1]MBB5750495.1 hypothetical protein [Micrococcus sp. TA1]